MANIKVESGGAPQGAFAILAPLFEKKRGDKLAFTFAVTSVIEKKIAAGESIDILVLPVPLLDRMQKDGIVRGDARCAFGTVALSMVARKGIAKPDISTPEKFKQALLAARSIVHSPAGMTPSGTHLGKLMEQLGIAAEMAKKTTFKPALAGGVELVGRGEVDFGIYPASEIINAKGLEVIGPLPPALTLNTVYGAAVTTKAAAGEAAAAFVSFLVDPAHRATWAATGFDPPPA